MAEEIIYTSSIAEWITGFVQEKKSLGYKYFNESKWMRMFDNYWTEHGYDAAGLTQENLSGWIKKRDTEGEKCFATRVCVIRQFAKYLNKTFPICRTIESRQTEQHLFLDDHVVAWVFVQSDPLA